MGSPSAGWIPTPLQPRVIASDRLDVARQAWADAYCERERALLFELARAEDSLIGVTMGPLALGERAELPASASQAPSMAPERRGPPSIAPECRADRSRSRPRKRGRKDKEARARRHRSPVDQRARRQRSPVAPPRRRASPSARARRANLPAPDAAQPVGDYAGQAPGLFAKSAASSRASSSPPLRRAPAECLAAWRKASMQRPPGDFGAEPPRPPLAAPAGSAADYQEEWGPFDVSPPEGAASDAPPGVFADREPAEPLRPPPAASAGPQASSRGLPGGLGAPGGGGACAGRAAVRVRGLGARVRVRGAGHLGRAPPPAETAGSRSVPRGHFPRRDPRHTGLRVFHAGGGAEICRQFNRGRCGGQVCAHNKAHVCSQCGVAGHAATGCTTPESAWPAKE